MSEQIAYGVLIVDLDRAVESMAPWQQSGWQSAKKIPVKKHDPEQKEE